MSEETFQTYKHSGKFGFHGPVLALLIAIVLGFPLGIAYAYLIRWIPIIYVNFLATFGYGALFGVITAALLKMAKVRNNALAIITSLLVGLIVLYLAWSGYAFMMFKDGSFFNGPEEIRYLVQYLYENGSWSLHNGGPVTGPMLAIVWIAEAGVIVGMATTLGAALVTKTPFCEDNQCWLDQTKNIETLQTFADPDQRAAFKAGDLAPLSKARPKIPGSQDFTRLTLKYSPKCDIFYTVRVQDVTLSHDRKGNLKVKVKPITKDLVLPHAMFELISRFENFKSADAVAPLAPPPSVVPPPAAESGQG